MVTDLSGWNRHAITFCDGIRAHLGRPEISTQELARFAYEYIMSPSRFADLAENILAYEGCNTLLVQRIADAYKAAH